MRTILLQLDPDRHASVFDSVVAVDAGVDQLLTRSQVRVEDVEGLVHGCMFTRGVPELRHTAIFIGGADVAAGESLLAAVTRTYFGPLRVSVMLDANGANSTAAAAVVAASRHHSLAGAHALVLGGTGPVGQRVARLLAGEGARVTVASRRLDKAQQVCDRIRERLATASLTPAQVAAVADLDEHLATANIVVAAGAAGVELLPEDHWASAPHLRVAIDLNAVPPLGIGGTNVTDKAVQRGAIHCYGAIGVGGTKMKIHRRAIQALFERNDQVLDAEEMLDIAKQLEG